MLQFFSRGQARLVAITVALVAMLSFAASAGAGVAHAASQANQQWFGPSCGNGCGTYLGWPSSDSSGFYHGEIHTFNAMDKCLEVEGSKFFWIDRYSNIQDVDPSGTQVQLWDCESYNSSFDDYAYNQRWVQYDNGDGSWSFYLVNSKGPFCLDSLMGHGYNGSPVEVWPCNSGTAQRWTIGPGGQLQSVDSPGFCLDDTDWNPNNGAKMQLWQCAY